MALKPIATVRVLRAQRQSRLIGRNVRWRSRRLGYGGSGWETKNGARGIWDEDKRGVDGEGWKKRERERNRNGRRRV